MKKCIRCKQSKPLAKFGSHRQKKDGLSPYCKKCRSIMRKLPPEERSFVWWKPMEIEFLKKHYSLMGARYCSEKLSRSITGVVHKANRFGLYADKIEKGKRFGKYWMDKFDKSGKPFKDINAWKRRIRIRDNFTCQDCKLYEPIIVIAHHKDSDPKLRFVLSNGITLCPNCHAKEHKRLTYKTSGNRLTKSDKALIRELRLLKKPILEIATILGINKKTVEAYL